MTTASDSRPEHRDPRVERTRAAVIEAATQLMNADGPSAVTHVNVAATANVSRTTVYKHYPTRVDLLRSAIEAMGKTAPDLSDLTGDLRQNLGLFFAGLVADLCDDQRAPMVATMLEQALHDSTFAAVRDQLVGDLELPFHHLIDTAISRGELRADVDARLAMASIAGSFLFLRYMAPSGFDAQTADRVLDEFVTANGPR